MKKYLPTAQQMCLLRKLSKVGSYYLLQFDVECDTIILRLPLSTYTEIYKDHSISIYCVSIQSVYTYTLYICV